MADITVSPGLKAVLGVKVSVLLLMESEPIHLPLACWLNIFTAPAGFVASGAASEVAETDVGRGTTSAFVAGASVVGSRSRGSTRVGTESIGRGSQDGRVSQHTCV